MPVPRLAVPRLGHRWLSLAVLTAISRQTVFLRSPSAFRMPGMWKLGPKSMHRRFQYSICGLLVFTAMVAAVMRYVGARAEQARRQRNLIAKLEVAHADVYYDYMVAKSDGYITTSRVPPPNFQYLRGLVGDDYFSCLGAVRFGVISNGPNGPFRSYASDELVASLQDQCELRLLSISGPDVTDKAACFLHCFPKLQCLELSGTKITDAAMGEIGMLTKIVVLNLSGTQITNEGTKHFEGLHELETLILNETKITDQGLRFLVPLTSMRTLDLSDVRIGDEAMLHMSKLTNLHTLAVEGTQITNASILHLTKMKNLRTLYLSRTALTTADLDALRTALPNAKINP